MRYDYIKLIEIIKIKRIEYELSGKKTEEVFYVMFKNDEEYLFKVHAIDDVSAAKIALDFVTENRLIDFGNKHKNTLLAVVSNPNYFNRTIIDNYDKTGKLIADKDIKKDEEINNYCPYCNNNIFLD